MEDSGFYRQMRDSLLGDFKKAMASDRRASNDNNMRLSAERRSGKERRCKSRKLSIMGGLVSYQSKEWR